MAVQFLDKIGTIMSNITSLGPAESAILFGVGFALIPPLYRGVLDQRIDKVLETLDYTRVILVSSTLLAYYYLFGAGAINEIILISGGFIVGSAVQSWLTTLTDL